MTFSTYSQSLSKSHQRPLRLNLLDELVADCMGMVAALGHFDADLIDRCLVIDTDNANQPIANGHWLSYTREYRITMRRRRCR